MNAEGRSLAFIVETEERYKIPFFQRPYVWNINNWNDLLTDMKSTDAKQFLGSIITKRIAGKGKSNGYTMVIDGQQRLTTLSILLKVIYDILSKKNKLDSKGYENIKNTLFCLEKKQYIVRIEHSHLDMAKYNEVIGNVIQDKKDRRQTIIDSIIQKEIIDELAKEKKENEELLAKGKKEKPFSVNESNLIRSCYKYFYSELIKESPKQIDKILTNLFDETNKILVKIEVDSNDHEQQIFDTINSAGMALSSTDIIKNALYEKLRQFKISEEKLLEYYEETWQLTFDNSDKDRDWWSERRSIGRFKRDNTEILLQAVGIINGIFNVENDTISDLASTYKSYIDKLKTEKDVKTFIESIMYYANIYKNKIPQFDPAEPLKYDDVKKRLSCIISVSENTTFTPYILYVYSKYENKEEKLIERLKMIERVLMHYLISGQTNKNFNKYCYQFVLKEKSGNEKDLKHYLEIEVDAFKNEDLLNGIKKVSNKLGKLFLYWIELHRYFIKDPKADNQNIALDYKTDRELEHIMPQKWDKDKDWLKQPIVDENGRPIPKEENPESYRTKMVYSLGNMTLLMKGLNSLVSNRIYAIKYKGDGKNQGMEKFLSLSISKEIEKDNPDLKWDEQKIAKREKELGNELIQMWGCKN